MRSFALAALWVVASIGAVTVAWAGVGVVNSEVIAPPPATIVPLITNIGSPDLVTGESPVDDQSIDTTDSTTTTSQPASAGQESGSGSSTTANASQSSTTSVPATSSVPDAAPAPTVTTTSTTVPATAPTPAAETQTFTLTGGSAAISFSASGLKLLWATANPDFGVIIEDQSQGLKIEFRSPNHRSRLDVWWENGPAHDIEERES